MQFQDCINSQIALNNMYTLYVFFILKSCSLVPRLHSLSFTSLSHFHPCPCPLSPPLVPVPSLFTDLLLNLYNTGSHFFLPTSHVLISSLPSPHSPLLTPISSLSSPHSCLPSFSLHILTRSHSLISSKSIFSFLYPHSDRDACERS